MAACDHLGFNVFYHTYQNYWNDLCRYNTPDISYDQFLTGVSMTYALFPPKAQLFSDYQTQLLNSCFSGGSSSSDPGTYVTGGTANGTNDTLVFTNSTGGTFTVANSALLFNDAFVSGGTLDTTTGCVTFKNTSGGTFQVCGFDGFTSYWTANTDGSISTSGMSDVNISGDVRTTGTLTVGVDDTGYDVKFFGATSGKYLLWDESDDALELTDNTKLKFGTGDDLQIYSDGTNGRVSVGSGLLQVEGNTLDFTDGSASSYLFRGVASGAVSLYYSGNKKLDTTNTGIDVTGEVKGDIISGTTALVKGNLGVSGRTLLGTIDAAGASYSTDKILVAQSNGEVEYLTKAQLQEDISAGYWTANTDGSISTSGMSSINVSGDVKTSGKILLGDGSVSDTYAGFGNSADLKIFHNGSHSIIRETGTGNLYLQSDNNVILSKDSSTEAMVKGIADGAVELYHDNVKKLETTDTGVEVTGNLTASTALFAPIITGTTGIINGNLGVSGRTLLGTIDAAGDSYSEDKILVAQSNGEIEYLTTAELKADIADADYWSANTDGTISTSGMSGVNVSGDVKTTESVEATQGFKAGDAVGIAAKANLLTRLEFNGANTINLLANDSDVLQIEPTLISMQQDIAVTNAKKLYWNDVNTYIKGTTTEIEIDGDDTVKIIADHDVTVNSGRLGITGKTIMGTVDAAGDTYTNNKILVVQSDGEVEYLTSQQIANLNSGTTKYWTGSTEQANSIVNSGMTLTKVGIGTAKPLKPLTVKGDISGSTAIYLGNHTNFISGETSASGDLTIHSGDDIELYAGDDIVLNTDCRVKFTYLTGDTAPHANPGIEFSLDDSPGNCLIQNGQENTVIAVTSADTRLYFNDIGGEYIVGDGTDLTIASGADIILTPTVNVGIGTTTPQKKLDIAGGDIRLDNSKSIFFATTDGNIGRVAITGDESSDFIQLKVDNSNNHILRLNTTGVGIGTSVPNEKLTVVGNVSASTSIFAPIISGTTALVNGNLGVSGRTLLGTIDAAGASYSTDKILVAQSNGEVEYLTKAQLQEDISAGYWSANTDGSISTSGNSNIQLADNTRLKFGAGDDLQIYSDSTNGRIAAGSGLLQIEGDAIDFTDGNATEYYIRCVANGAVSLYHDANEKIVTTPTGINVTGNLTASTSLFAPIITGTTAMIEGNLGVSGNSIVTGDLTTDGILYTDDIRRLTDNSTSTRISMGGNNLYIFAGSATNAHVNFRSTFGTVFNDGGTAAYDFRVEGVSDTHLIFADAGTDKVGIGTTAANEKLTVVGNISASTSIFSPIISGTTALVNGNLGVSGRTLLGTIDAAGASYSTDKILVAQSNGEVEYLTKAQLQEDISAGYWTANTDGSISTSGMSSIKVSGDVKTTGTLYVASKVELGGDSDTFIQFAEDAIGITAGGEQLITISESGQDIVKIGDGGDVDFQVRTENDDNTLYIVGETDNVGIGTNSPIGKLDVNGGVNVTGDTTMLGQLIVSGTGENLMSGDLNMEGGDIVLDNQKKVKFKNTAGTEFGNILMNGSNDMIFQNARTGSDILIRAGGSGSGDTIFTTNQSGTDTEIMIVKGETTHLLGGVGIKTSLPNEALTVVGNISASTSVFSPIISGTTSLVNGNLGVTGNTLISGELGIGTAPSAALHISTADNVLTKLVSTDSIATIELGDNSTSNQAVLTRVSNDLKICKDGGNVGLPIAPKTKLDVQHNPTSLSNNTGGGESVTFGTASGSLTQGKLYYLNTSGVWTSTQANASSSNGSNQLLGIALGTAVSDGLLIRGFFDMHSYLTGTFNEGIPLYVCETTAGNINVAAPGATNEFVRVVGYCTNTSKVIYFNPDGTYITVA